MKTLIAGAMLIALPLPAVASNAPASPLPGVHCVPYAQAVHDIVASGGYVLGTSPAPYTRNGMMLYFTEQNVVLAAGVAGANTCVFMPAAVAGHLGFDSREL